MMIYYNIHQNVGNGLGNIKIYYYNYNARIKINYNGI
jgi:hypothetical protein